MRTPMRTLIAAGIASIGAAGLVAPAEAAIATVDVGSIVVNSNALYGIVLFTQPDDAPFSGCNTSPNALYIRDGQSGRNSGATENGAAAVLAVLMAAKLNNRKVTVFYDLDSNSGRCFFGNVILAD